MNSGPDFDVLIVGAGIAGAALVTALADAGLRLGIVEARDLSLAPENKPPADIGGFDSRVSAITPASETFLEDIGAWQRIPPARLTPYGAMRVWDADGTGEILFEAAELDAPVLGHIVENGQLTAALLEEVGKRRDLEVFSPARLDDVQTTPDGVSLVLDDGAHLTAGLLVAADGALSRVRDLAGFRTREWDYGQHALVTTVQTEKPHQGTAWQRFLGTGPLAFLPLPDLGEQHHCSIVWSAEPELAQELEGMESPDFCQALGEAIEHRLGQVQACSARTVFPLRQRHAVDYIQPGIALVGDAAHTIHPLAGQGINLGLQDVRVLAEELKAGVGRGELPGDLALLRRFQRRRKGENLLMMAAMDGFKSLFGARSLPLRWLRNQGLNLVDQAGPLKHQLMRHAMGVR